MFYRKEKREKLPEIILIENKERNDNESETFSIKIFQ